MTPLYALALNLSTILTLHNKVVTHNSRIAVTHDNHRTWNLHIKQVKEADRGCYMCQINTNIMKKQIGCVDVHVLNSSGSGSSRCSVFSLVFALVHRRERERERENWESFPSLLLPVPRRLKENVFRVKCEEEKAKKGVVYMYSTASLLVRTLVLSRDPQRVATLHISSASSFWSTLAGPHAGVCSPSAVEYLMNHWVHQMLLLYHDSLDLRPTRFSKALDTDTQANCQP
ncbi:hypothetical protein B566_EDAN015815, partial [Ephemera danica]